MPQPRGGSERGASERRGPTGGGSELTACRRRSAPQNFRVELGCHVINHQTVFANKPEVTRGAGPRRFMAICYEQSSELVSPHPSELVTIYRKHVLHASSCRANAFHRPLGLFACQSTPRNSENSILLFLFDYHLPIFDL